MAARLYPGVEDLKVAVMGCVVNGPGESKHADLGISLPGNFEEPKARSTWTGRTCGPSRAKASWRSSRRYWGTTSCGATVGTDIADRLPRGNR